MSPVYTTGKCPHEWRHAAQKRHPRETSVAGQKGGCLCSKAEFGVPGTYISLKENPEKHNSGDSPPTDNVAEFELLDHPADVGFRARSEALEDLFVACARALISIILDPSDVRQSETWELSAEGGDLESLLVNWLNEVLYFVDTKRIVFGGFGLKLQGASRVECTCSGEKRDSNRHPVRVLVKAVTYHQLRIAQSEQGWTAEVYVDV